MPGEIRDQVVGVFDTHRIADKSPWKCGRSLID
jgi:hypothetical protein